MQKQWISKLSLSFVGERLSGAEHRAPVKHQFQEGHWSTFRLPSSQDCSQTPTVLHQSGCRLNAVNEALWLILWNWARLLWGLRCFLVGANTSGSHALASRLHTRILCSDLEARNSWLYLEYIIPSRQIPPEASLIFSWAGPWGHPMWTSLNLRHF